MISAWFLIPALMVGALFGIGIMCLIQMNRMDEEVEDLLDEPETISDQRVKEMLRFIERNRELDKMELGI